MPAENYHRGAILSKNRASRSIDAS